jgi:hypothetical protein
MSGREAAPTSWPFPDPCYWGGERRAGYGREKIRRRAILRRWTQMRRAALAHGTKHFLYE